MCSPTHVPECGVKLQSSEAPGSTLWGLAEGAARQFKELMFLLYRLSHPPVVRKNVFIAVWYFFFFTSPVSNFGSYVSLTVTEEEAGRSFRYTDTFFFFFFFWWGDGWG